MDARSEDAVSNFCSITGASTAQAKFFLDSSGGDLDSAIAFFFDHGGNTESDAPSGTGGRHAMDLGDGDAPPPAIGSNASSGANTAAAPTAPVVQEGGRGGSQRPSGRAQASSNSRIRTMSDLRSGGGHHSGGADDEDEDGDENDDPLEYYTGGEKSGMMVQDPNRRRRDQEGRGGGGVEAAVDSIFERARQHGAREGTAEDMEPIEARRGRPGAAFTGVARTLAGPSPLAAGAGSPAAAGGGSRGEGREAGGRNRRQHTITFWLNGFTVDDGPLRQFNDPANARFLASLHRGECPEELSPGDPSVGVEVNLVKKQTNWESPPQPKYVSFSGTSRRLGGGGEGEATEAATASPAVAAEAVGTTTSLSSSSFELKVDESQPVTSIQLRLLDGTRMVARFNVYHTVGDIRRFLVAARPGSRPDFKLQLMGFPPVVLADNESTIAEAKLEKAVIMQK
eukprot:TRINITY_DN5750_c0_g1_i1.p1 TRINITY_DN5750_c0_g1~~TRINITY_DN5750_c0_g1_i1.p1  ORF type:complete len:474 (+),score=122.78 TRINITY_DN5750_c0_g1_i1:61-1422(+)